MECIKICYNLKEAKTELNRVKKLNKKWRTECRIYKCDVCADCHHLTSEKEFEHRVYLKEEELIFCELWKKLKGE